MEHLIRTIISREDLHAKWLNTLSFLENCGARKIAACEHKTLVKKEMLKHAAEEFRHAHDLKKQIKKITPTPPPTYALPSLLGGIATLHYLPTLDLHISRLLRQRKLPLHHSYLLVTYAIELRARILYPLYHTLLKEAHSKVSVRSIYLEEEEHLAEITSQMKDLPPDLGHYAITIEESHFQKWLASIKADLLNALSKITQCTE